MNRIFLDFKKLILGQDNSEKMPLDFKEEVAVSIKTNLIDKARASLLIIARNNSDKLGDEIDKKQIADVSGKVARVSKQKAEKRIEEIETAEKNIKKKIKRNKEEQEKKEKEESLRQTLHRIAEQEELSENKNYRQKRRLKNKSFQKKYLTNIIKCVKIFYCKLLNYGS